MNTVERKQANGFQDAIGEIVDQYLREGMSVETMKTVLKDEADHIGIRKEYLEHGL